MAPEKRKLGDQKPDKQSKSSKKQRTKQHVEVHHLSGSEAAKPVIGTGTSLLSASLRFSSFARKGESETETELLLHSASHDTIDFSAVESRTVDANERHLKHYVAVFDPANKRLNVTEAKKLTVKRQVRKLARQDEGSNGQQGDDEDEAKASAAVYSSRVALTEAFGSKKSKKAVATIAENRLIANSTNADDPLAKAIVSTNAVTNEDDEEEGDGLGETTKPLPPANVKATDVKEVYPLSTLVVPQPTAATLDSMPLSEWKRLLSKKEPISSRYRYIAPRVAIVGQRYMQKQSDKAFLQTLQVLRYIELLLDVHRYISAQPRNKPLPHAEHWAATSIKDGGQIPEYVVKQVAIHFFPDSRPTNFALTRLRTYILALTLHIPPGLAVSAGPGLLAVEPSDVLMDLALPPSKHTGLYRELGCRVERAKESEIARWRLDGLEKKSGSGSGGGKKPVFAKLMLPLDFPKLSQGRGASSRGRR